MTRELIEGLYQAKTKYAKHIFWMMRGGSYLFSRADDPVSFGKEAIKIQTHDYKKEVKDPPVVEIYLAYEELTAIKFVMKYTKKEVAK